MARPTGENPMEIGKFSETASLDRRRLLGTTAAGIVAGLAGLMPSPLLSAGDPVRPFRVDVPEENLADLRRRLRATRWPDRETVDDTSQGVPLAKLKSLVEYWGTVYD